MTFFRPQTTGLIALATVSLMASTALAADFSPDTRIDAVTVYPAGAEIAREVPFAVPQGDHRLVLDDLPAGIDANDVRVEGSADTGLIIQSVDVARVPVRHDLAKTDSLRREREQLGDDKAEREGAIRTAEVQRQLILSLVRPQLPIADGQAAAPGFAPEQLFTFIAERHGEIETRIRTARQDIRAIDRRIAEIDRALSRTQSNPEWQSRVTVTINASAEASGSLTLRYRTAQASWHPVYDARLDTRAVEDGLTLTQRAVVRQRTGEDWSGVSLSLGTAQPHAGTSAPDVQVRYVGFERPRRERTEERLQMNDVAAPAMAPMPESEVAAKGYVVEQDAVVADLGFDTLYTVPGKADIPATGDARTVLVADYMTDAGMEVRVVPAQRAAAFLTVKFSHDGPAPLPAGTVRLFRDGVFVGNGHLPVANSGQDTELGFGLDERVTVTRTLVSARQGEEGIFSRARTNTNDWRTVIANHHAVPVSVVVLESLPQARDEKITVTPLTTNDAADETDVDDKSGVLAWRFDLDAQDERTLSFGYRIDWPEGREVIVGMR